MSAYLGWKGLPPEDESFGVTATEEELGEHLGIMGRLALAGALRRGEAVGDAIRRAYKAVTVAYGAAVDLGRFAPGRRDRGEIPRVLDLAGAAIMADMRARRLDIAGVDFVPNPGGIPGPVRVAPPPPGTFPDRASAEAFASLFSGLEIEVDPTKPGRN